MNVEKSGISRRNFNDCRKLRDVNREVHYPIQLGHNPLLCIIRQ